MVRAYNHICAADKCYNSRTTHPNKGFFGFPSDVQLCETWLTNCGRKDLSGQGVVKSNGYYKLCADHFEDKFFTDSTKTLLNRSLNPVPTIFVNNITTLLPPGSQAPTSDIDLPDLSDDEDASMYCETLINPYELMVESNRLPISFRFKSLCTRRDYDGETISQALLNLEPETELHQIDELCRFCMNKASNEYLELFAESSEVSEIRKICDEILPNKLEICDGLPYKVCQKCVGDLRTCHRLMEQFRHADQYLRAIAKYSLFIENEDDVKPVWEEKIDNFKEFIKPLPKKATVMPLKHFKPVVEGIKGYVEDVTPNTTLKSTDNDSCTNDWSKKNYLSFDGIEADSQPIIIRSSDNDNSVSHILNNFPLQTTDMDLISERDLWQDDIDLICSNVIILPEKKLLSQESTPMDTEKYINNNEMITSALTPNEDSDQTLNIHKIVNYFTSDENKSLEHFSINGTDIPSDEFTSNPIKDINFEINLMNVKSLENQPDLTVSYKCLQCSDLFPTYSDLVDHVIDVHQIKPLPSPFTCEECAMRFDDAASLIQHIKEQHLAERIPCSLCPNQEGFKSMAELNRHRRDIHSIKCDKCERLFYSQEKLDKHMNFKHDDRIVCSICQKVLSSVQGRKLHELTHTDRSEMCWVCGVVVKNKQVLQKHMQRHGDETYPCDMCDKLFPSMLCLQRHKKGHSSTNADTSFICHICPKSFGRKHHLNKHLLAHSKGQLFMCDFCGRGFRRNDKLMLHEAKRKALGGTCPVYKNLSFDRKGSSSLNLKSTEEGSLECDVCGRKFLKAYNATRHKRYHFCQGNPEVIQKLLDEPEEYNCDKCGKQFFTKHTLQLHMATKHTGVSKPYACEFCPKKFRTRTQIVMHELVHSGERRYACTECGKRFKTKTHLLHHESVHTEQKTHICPLCGAAFKSRSHLLEHTFYHKDAESVRPFQCEECGNRFVSKSILKAHITKNHSSDSLQEKENIQAQGVGYPCSVCGKILVNLIACKKHMRRMHRNISVKTEEDIKTEYIETNDNETEDNVMDYIETEYIETEYIETDYVETEDIETEDIETEYIETEDIETEDVGIEDIETENIEIENIETEGAGTEDIETEDIETENVITEEYGVEVADIETENVVIENYETETEDIETYIVTEDYGIEIEDVVTEVYGIEADLDENK